jgi:mannose PTS system EIID component
VNAADPRPLSPGVLGEILVRSFFLQAQWNFQRMQNLGWLFSLWPALRRLYPSSDARARVASEHMEYFNSHPYLTNIILGTVAGLEEDHALGRPVRRDQILAAKKFMSGPLAALGDTVFWATARPLFGLLALALGMTFRPDSAAFVPVLFLIFHNVLHLVVRGGGLWAGYRLKAQVVSFLIRLNLQGIVRAATFLGVGLGVGLMAVLAWGFGPRWVWCVPFVMVSFLLLRFGVSATRLFYIYLAGGIATGLIFNL